MGIGLEKRSWQILLVLLSIKYEVSELVTSCMCQQNVGEEIREGNARINARVKVWSCSNMSPWDLPQNYAIFELFCLWQKVLSGAAAKLPVFHTFIRAMGNEIDPTQSDETGSTNFAGLTCDFRASGTCGSAVTGSA